MATLFNPEDSPVLRVDDHLPAVDAATLQPSDLRRRFASPPAWQPEAQIERRSNERALAHASVLVPLVLRDDLRVLLTQRTADLTDHPGQISFPGGRAEPHDADAVATALREAREEIGLDAAFVDVLGAMPLYTTGTGFVVTPVVAFVNPGFSIQPDPSEVAEVFEVPLSFLMNPANHRHHAFELAGAKLEFLSIPWEGLDAQGQPRRYFVWGATAAMLRNLYRFLAA